MSFSISRRQFLQGTAAIAAIFPFSAAFGKSATAATITSVGEDILEQLWQTKFLEETENLVRIPTYLDPSQSTSNLEQVQSLLYQWADEFNTTELTQLKLEPFEWKKTVPVEDTEKEYWLFGLRIGSSNPARTVAMICHLDTVPPGEEIEGWEPFEPKIEKKEYVGKVQDFLVGRGTIDDKGPAISAFIVARAVAKHFDGTNQLNDMAVEIFFDTSEESDMATPHYLDDEEKLIRNPDFGIVYDAQWVVRAEKGCERPVFAVNSTGAPQGSLWIESLRTAPQSATNQIPDWAEAVIKGDPEALTAFCSQVETQYSEHLFDDPEYRRATLQTPVPCEDGVVLRTLVAGAQHGSAPDENREDGANPLVSLANFLADLVSDGTLAVNAVGTMAEFIQWMWGTRVFGENHDLLEAHDQVFLQGNGTTYAVTKFETDTTTGTASLEIDIRYAIPHHEQGWDGQTEGLLPGNQSKFPSIFSTLLEEFNATYPAYPPASLTSTRTVFVPDIRLPSNPNFQRVKAAYEEVTGKTCPELAVGGGTDAKGYTFLLGAGPLFSTRMGPPINYHGIGEGAPLEAIYESTKVLYNVMVKEVEAFNATDLASRLEQRRNPPTVKGKRPEAFKGHQLGF